MEETDCYEKNNYQEAPTKADDTQVKFRFPDLNNDVDIKHEVILFFANQIFIWHLYDF